MTPLKVIFNFLALCIILGDAWKTCDQVPFCRRLRKNESPSKYALVTITVTDNAVYGNLLKIGENFATVLVTISSLENDIFRIVIYDAIPLKPRRHSVPEALNDPQATTSGSSESNNDCITLKNGNGRAVIYKIPFKIEIYTGQQLVSILNANQRLVFENSAPNVSVGLDVRFPGAEVGYGLPLHADHLALRTTTKENPYRLFNVDNYGYKVESTEALYGSVPVLYAHGTKHTSGVFWLNSAQTWVDLEVTPQHLDSYFMSETGRIDTFILTGPTLPNTVMQYSKLTGVTPLPQYFTLGYHQSRFSYMSQEEVEDVLKQFKINNLPVDVIWLDVDYTLDKKYFTWNTITFPDPIGLQNLILGSGKKLVAIIDPHIKNETGYFIHDEAVKSGYYIKNPDGSNYVGDCWPGPSGYLDLTNKNAFNYYASLYETTNTFQNKVIHIWNDMNEPSVFYSAPSDIEEYEKTIPLNTVHFGSYEHRDVHNIYGLLQTMATRKGMLARKNNTVRPFILTRSHFAGSQRYASIWTGDNYASWEYLKISIPMCLTEALAGISFCGADVGGFAGIPSDELYQRWHQTGAWLPFYRGHSDTSVPRREPYRWSEKVQVRVRNSLNQRYAHLPTWYTLFFEHECTGEPVIRPISYHYPKEADALEIDTQFLVGSDILVAPVLSENAKVSSIYLPGGGHEVWYNTENNFTSYTGSGYFTFNVSIDSVPVFYRGGGIITRRDTPRLSSVETHSDPFTVYISPDINGSAKGRIYVDDYETFEYKNSKRYVYSELNFSGDKVSLNVIDAPNYETVSSITKIVILNSPKVYNHAKLENNKVQIDVAHNLGIVTVTISNCSLKLHVPFEIKLS